MKMKNNMYIYIVVILLLATVFGILQDQLETKESITYFPPNPSITYKTANTSLTLLEPTHLGEYTLLWRVSSSLDQNAYLRQDISFLFKNGILVEKMGKWEQNTNRLVQEKHVIDRESSYFTTISFHHSEIHDEMDEIFSSQRLSGDQLYVIDSSFSPLSSFRHPESKEENEWKKIIDGITDKYTNNSWHKVMKLFSIKAENYYLIPLTKLTHYNTSPLPGFSLEETQKIIGRLWEGLYKNYFLGIKINNKIIDPIGSTVPLVMLSKDRSHLLVISETQQGEPIILQQQIPNP